MTNEELVAEIYESHERQDRRPGVPPMCLDCAPLAWPCDAVRAADALEASEARVKELEAQVKDFKCEQVLRISEMQELVEAQQRISELEAKLAARQPGENDREALRIAVGRVVRDVMNFPQAVQARLLGQDMPPLRDALVDSVVEAGFSRTAVPDAQGERVSMEVLNEYRRIAAWLESQAALRGATGDTMHGLAAEALATLIDHEYSRHTIPLYGMLDVWMALYGTSHPEFDEFYDEHGYAEVWSHLMAEVRSKAAVPDAATAESEQRAWAIAGHLERDREAVKAERDAALAAIQRVQETLSLHNPNGRLVKEVLAALDGAPEPEEKP